MSVRLWSIKDVLNICLQNEILLSPASIHRTCDFRPHMRMYVDPAIKLIKHALEQLKVEVLADTDKFRELMESLSTEDHEIYDASFRKSINEKLGGDPTTYSSMLTRCSNLRAGCQLREVMQQPTSQLIPLVFETVENIPAYKKVIQETVDIAKGVIEKAAEAARLAGHGHSRESDPIKVIYRPNDQTKSPYRMIEKSLTKGPNPNYPDVSKVFDVFGCIIDCANYNSIGAVVDAFSVRHTRGNIKICRVKDRWTFPSSGGWRDLMLNLQINDIVFEVQIVLRSMLVARTSMDAHKAYNQFRSFAEVFQLLSTSPKKTKKKIQLVLKISIGFRPLNP